ncbi:hypothetical protein D3C75_455820 [compost metagenome]
MIQLHERPFLNPGHVAPRYAQLLGNLALPSTTGASVYRTCTVSSDVPLTAGVQVMRVYIGGTSNIINLDQIYYFFNS